jgi:hypothetical protein
MQDTRKGTTPSERRNQQYQGSAIVKNPSKENNSCDVRGGEEVPNLSRRRPT